MTIISHIHRLRLTDDFEAVVETFSSFECPIESLIRFKGTVSLLVLVKFEQSCTTDPCF